MSRYRDYSKYYWLDGLPFYNVGLATPVYGYKDGGYVPSPYIKNRIANWEGSSMLTNRSFEDEARDFNRVLPKGSTEKLTQQQLDALYSYSYNVGAGRFKQRVQPVLNAYLHNKATKEDVQRAMYATKDNELRGLTLRRNDERAMFGGNYRTIFTGTGGSPMAYNSPVFGTRALDSTNPLDKFIAQQQQTIDSLQANVVDTSDFVTAVNPYVYGSDANGDSPYLQKLQDTPLYTPYADGGIVNNQAPVYIANINDTGTSINEYKYGGEEKTRRTVYKSRTGKVFNTAHEAAVDNYNAIHQTGRYRPTPTVYTVQSGDNLWNISRRYGTTVDKLKSMNSGLTDLIHPNQKITVATGRRSIYDINKEWADNKKLATNLQVIQAAPHNGNYVVVDKPNSTLTVYNAQNKPLYSTRDISTGASGNDYNTITYMDDDGTIKNLAGNSSTPAGIARVQYSSMYHGYPSFVRQSMNSNGKWADIASSLHWGSTASKRSSNGCVRIGGKALVALNNYIKPGTMTYTIPEKPGSRFMLRDGKLQFTADNPYGSATGRQKYWDDYNTYTDKSYNPLIIVPKQQTDNANVNKYISGIERNKASIMKRYNIDSDTYNRLARLALGIAQQETKYGSSLRYKAKNPGDNWYIRSVIAPYNPALAVSPTSLNMLAGSGISAYHALKDLVHGRIPTIASTAPSKGLTQIKLAGDNSELQRDYNNYGISDFNINDADKSATATMLRLANMYSNEVRGAHYVGAKGKAIDPYDALMYKWMGLGNRLVNTNRTKVDANQLKDTYRYATPETNKYIQNVKRYADNFNMYSVRQ